MKINLWYNQSMRQWRWTLADECDTMVQESGQRTDLRDAMNDVANTVEHVLHTRIPE